MSLMQMSVAGALMILATTVIRALAINRVPKKTFLVLWGAALIPSLLWYFFHRRQELLAEERKAEEAKEAAEGEANE